MLTELLGAAGSIFGGGGGTAASPGVLDSGHVSSGDVNVGAKSSAWAMPVALVVGSLVIVTGLYFILRLAPRK